MFCECLSFVALMRTPVRPDPRHDLSLRITLIAVMRLSNERKTQHTRAFPLNTPLPTVISYTQSGPTHNEMKRTSSLFFVFHVCSFGQFGHFCYHVMHACSCIMSGCVVLFMSNVARARAFMSSLPRALPPLRGSSRQRFSSP